MFIIGHDMNIDYTGILDRCSECKARACFKTRQIGQNRFCCQCSECANGIDWQPSKLDAWQQWNHEQRKALGRK